MNTRNEATSSTSTPRAVVLDPITGVMAACKPQAFHSPDCLDDARATLRWIDYRGFEQTRIFNQTIDVRAFIGTPGYSLLVVAANTHLSIANIEHFLDERSREAPGTARSKSWIQRRRWLFQRPGTDNNTKRPVPDLDGKQARAVAVMSEYPKASLYELVGILREHGIKRSREWVRLHRCDSSLTT